ncbi:MAG: Ig-like domain-containing protein [Candidatus Eisenbacteria bacterium]
MRRRIRALETLALALLVAAASGCAKKGMPTGGPPDLDPPRLVRVVPDSGAAGVPLDTRIVLEFSEGMEPRGTGDAIELAPPVRIRQRRWSGRTLTLVLGDSLAKDRTYTLFIGGNARDRHGNPFSIARSIVFTTAPVFPPGALEGKIDAVGFRAPGTLLWAYRDGRAPDSTARDFDALGVADGQGHFRISGIAAPARWRLWAFADLNHNRSFEPDADLLASADTTLELTAELPEAKDLFIRMINPRAPGRFAGSIVDTLNDSLGALRLIVTNEADTTRRLLYEVIPSGFDFKWDPGTYRVQAFRDMDRNKAWKRDTEPASEEVRVVITPGGEVVGLVFVLVRAGTSPSGSSP